MVSCPCCSGLLLPHIRGDGETHWFCRHCWQDMPVYSLNTSASLTDIVVKRLTCSFHNKKLGNNADLWSQHQTINGLIELRDILT